MDYNEDTKDCQSINLGLIDEACWPIFIQPLNGSKSDMLELVNGLETDLQLQKKFKGSLAEGKPFADNFSTHKNLGTE